MRPLLTLLLLVSLCAAQTSDGTQPLPAKIVSSMWNPNCSMTDIGQDFFNERALVCAIGQTHFLNGEIRLVDSGEGVVASATPFNGHELTSCACAQNATWTRTMTNGFLGQTALIRWTWKFFARKDDCSLELKRDLVAYGCSYETACNCPEGQTCSPTKQDECKPISPIAIDLDGDGLWFTSRNEGVEFDLDGNGIRGRLPWLKEDGWLVLDDRADGVIRDGLQLFGDQSAQSNRIGELPNGYAALRGFDDNRDELITAADGVWGLLRVWQDFNLDGISGPGETSPLSRIGISAISLRYKESRHRDPQGNELRYRARVYWVSGAHTSSWDVFLGAVE